MAERKPNHGFELGLGYLLPGFLVLGVLVNLVITQVPRLRLSGFALIAIHANDVPDYSQDPVEMQFPPVNLEIIKDANNDNALVPAAPAAGEATVSASPNVAATATPRPSSTQAKPSNTPHASATPVPSNTPNPSSTPGPGNTPKPSHTPKPGNTPAPSNTPKPNNTPNPSHTPKPSKTPKP